MLAIRDLRARDADFAEARKGDLSAREIRRGSVARFQIFLSDFIPRRIAIDREREATAAPFSSIDDMYVGHTCESKDTFPTFARSYRPKAASSSD